MSLYGYARASICEQDVNIQRTALTAVGCDVIRTEGISGARRDGRTELQTLLDLLRPGDILVVTRVDRLARSVRELQTVVRELGRRGVVLRATEQLIDTSTASGKAFLDVLGLFVESETRLRRERQRRASQWPRRGGCTQAADRASTPLPCSGCTTSKGLGRQRSRSSLASGGPASTECSPSFGQRNSGLDPS